MSDKLRRPWFQLHLSTAIVLMFVAGYSMLLWQWRSPWNRSNGYFYSSRLPSPYSPDGTRYVAAFRRLQLRIFAVKAGDSLSYGDGYLHSTVTGAALDENERLIAVIENANGSIELGFIDDDTIVTLDGHERDQSYRFSMYKRRFPEAWWGQFYRLEVWIGVAAVLVWQAYRMFRRREARAP